MRVFSGLALATIILAIAACQDHGADTERDAVHSGAMVLAASWQPAFCETATRRPECRSQTRDRYDANHFALHGLWPQPGSNVYCNVSDEVVEQDRRRRWRELAGLDLSAEIRRTLQRVMPGSQSFLHRHEWIKHGTCYSADAETYYRDSLNLMDALNTSSLRDLFAGSLGQHLSVETVRREFDKAFGRGAGKRVRLSCRRDGRRQIIVELTIGLKGRIASPPDFGALIHAAPSVGGGCPGGIVDPVGLQ